MAGGSSIWFFQQGISLPIAFREFKLLSSVCRGEKTGIPSYGLNLGICFVPKSPIARQFSPKNHQASCWGDCGGKIQQPDRLKCWLFKQVSCTPVDTQFFCGHKGGVGERGEEGPPHFKAPF